MRLSITIIVFLWFVLIRLPTPHTERWASWCLGLRIYPKRVAHRQPFYANSLPLQLVFRWVLTIHPRSWNPCARGSRGIWTSRSAWRSLTNHHNDILGLRSVGYVFFVKVGVSAVLILVLLRGETYLYSGRLKLICGQYFTIIYSVIVKNYSSTLLILIQCAAWP